MEEEALALVLADARAPALLASAPDALVPADARPPALLGLLWRWCGQTLCGFFFFAAPALRR